LREFLVPLTYCLVGFIGIYLLFELFDSSERIMENHPPALTVLRFFAGYLSPYLEWLIPAALLLGTLYTMWNFCRHSELTAMRANGIGFIVIVRPLLAVAALMAILVACINEFYAPGASEQARKTRDARFKPGVSEIEENIPYYNQQAGRVWRINKMSSDNAKRLEGVRLSFDRPDGSRQVEITCRKAEYLDGMWWLFYPQYTYSDALNQPVPSPSPALSNLPLRAMPELTETPLDFINESKDWMFFSVRDMLRYLKAHPGLAHDEVMAKRYDIHYRLAAPWACLVITVFAIPAGVATGRQSVFKGVLLAIALFFGFYAAVNGCMILAKRDILAPWLGAWLPNLTFLAAGLAMFFRQR
jgi:lipopolysaccharide export system permease protein